MLTLVDHNAPILFEELDEGSSCSAHQYLIRMNAESKATKKNPRLFPAVSNTLTPSSSAALAYPS